MGTNDVLWVKLSCGDCSSTEVSSASDKGSVWGEPSWRSLGTFDSFDVAVSGGGKEEPKVDSAVCKKCGGAASAEEAYGFGRPKGF